MLIRSVTLQKQSGSVAVPTRIGATRHGRVAPQAGLCRLCRFAHHSVRATPPHTPSGEYHARPSSPFSVFLMVICAFEMRAPMGLVTLPDKVRSDTWACS